MMDEAPPPEFSFPVDVTTLPPSGRSYTIEASEDERARVAERLDLQKIDALSATVDVMPDKKGHIKVTGQMKADVTQTCVVSLAPVPEHVSDSVIANFITEERAALDKLKRERAQARAQSKGRHKHSETDEEEVLAAHGEDPPEVALEGRIDLGEIVVVHLALALDPYPRAAGAAFDAKAWGAEPEKDAQTGTVSPFAALAKLKKPKS